MGFRQMKMQCGSEPTVAASVERVRVMREAIGPDIDLMCDINQLWSVHHAIEVGQRIEPYHLFWLEDPTAHDDYRRPGAHRRCARPRPIAAGEYHYGIVPFRHLLEARSIDIVMIDLLRVGGITQWMKVAGMAEAFNLPVVSHLIPEIHVHLIAAIPNGLTVEYMPWTLRALRGAAEDRGRPAGGATEARPRAGLRSGGDQALPGQLTMEESVSASKPIPEIYRRLGVRPVIHGSGTTTRYGGSRLRPEVFETMREASQTLVNIDELNAAAGAAIARMLGAEAAFVSAGASSGLILQAPPRASPATIPRRSPACPTRAACATRSSSSARTASPTTRPIAWPAVSSWRSAWPGARSRSSSRTRSPTGRPRWPISSRRSRARPAFSRSTRWWPSRTAATCRSSWTPRPCCRRATTSRSSCARAPICVSFSGGKGIRGPQSTGILAGRRDLIKAVTINASPNQALARAAKTSKEEIAGLVVALELFMAEDEKAETKRYTEMCTAIVEALEGVVGVRAVVEHDGVNRVIPHAVVYFTSEWNGPSGHAIQVALAQGEPHLYVQQGGHQGGYFDEIAVDPINLLPGEEQIVAARLREALTGQPKR